MAFPSLSVCIVNWNTADLLIDCLRHIHHQSAKNPEQQEPMEVVVVDNDSTDDSVARVTAAYSAVKVIVQERNEGYSRAANKGIRETKGKFIVIMNPDVFLGSGSLAALEDFLKSHPDAGSCGPKLFNQDGSLQFSCRRFPNLATGLFRSTILGRLFPANLANQDYLMSDFAHNQPVVVDWLSGACLALRREAWEQVGGLDEDFFMFCEDVDLCWRMNRAGWKNYYVPQATAVHRIAASTSQMRARMTFEWHRSMYRFYRKHYAPTHSLPWRLLAVAGIAARCAAGMAKAWWHESLGGSVGSKA
jgi:hypothetical protein